GSPVRTRTTVATVVHQTLPSPIRPVCAALTTTPIRSSASSSAQSTSSRTFGTRSTWYSAPRYTSVWPRCRPYPLASLTVMPCTPNTCSADFTSSSLNGLITAVMSFMRPASRDRARRPPGTLRCAPASPGGVSQVDTDCFRPVKRPAVMLRRRFAGGPARQPTIASTHVSGSNRARASGPFAQADQLDWYPEFPLDRHHDPALGRAVQLGQHDPGDVHGLREHPRLAQPVLPGGGVQHEQYLIHGRLALDDALDLAKLIHQA